VVLEKQGYNKALYTFQETDQEKSCTMQLFFPSLLYSDMFSRVFLCERTVQYNCMQRTQIVHFE